MILGAVEISADSLRLCVLEVEGDRVTRILDRRHAVTASLENLERLSALVMVEVEAARDLGAQRTEVTAVSELRGTRLLRLIEKISLGLGLGPVRIPAQRENTAAAFLAASTPGDGEPVGVALVVESIVGLAVGPAGVAADWVGTRPVGPARISERAGFSDPPRPPQVEAAISGVCRGIAQLAPPPMPRLLVASPFAAVVERLCGGAITAEDARRGLDSILGQTADDLSAWFGLDEANARLLPGTLVVHLVLAQVFGLALEPTACEIGAGRHWMAERRLVPDGGPA